MIQVNLIAFGVLKDWLGSKPVAVKLREGATVAEMLALVGSERGAMPIAGIAVSINAEYARADHVLRAGDEVGLLPPVSGGSGTADYPAEAPSGIAAARLTRETIDASALAAGARQAMDGAVVVFEGIVRDNSRGRKTLHLDYEAYEQMAEQQMKALAAEARATFAVRDVTIVHRLGRLEIGETSVLIVVASAHRAQAFDACRWLIDTLKKTVPIWKRETFEDGAVWADGEPFPQELEVAANSNDEP